MSLYSRIKIFKPSLEHTDSDRKRRCWSSSCASLLPHFIGRFGQQPNVSFSLYSMIKDSVEEKIFQKGKKKMVLDHLIVQNMANEEDTDVQSE